MKLLYVLRIPLTLNAPSRGVPVAENNTDMGERCTFVESSARSE